MVPVGLEIQFHEAGVGQFPGEGVELMGAEDMARKQFGKGDEERNLFFVHGRGV